MTLDEAIKHAEEVAEKQEKIAIYTPIEMLNSDVDIEKCQECANEHRQLAKWLKDYKRMKEQEPTAKNDLALLEQTYDDFCKCEGGEGWLKIDGKEYATDAGYAIEGVDIFMEVFKRRLAELPAVTPQEPRKGHWIVREDNTSFVKQIPRRWVECSYCGWSFSYDRIKDNFCPYCGSDNREVKE